MKIKKHFIFKCFRKILKKSKYTNNYVDIEGQKANDYIRERIIESFNSNSGLMISKFGTVELDNICCWLVNREPLSFKNYKNYLRGQYTLYPDDALEMLCQHAGFFPYDINLWEKYVKLVLEDIKDIDVLASYISVESMVTDRMNCKKVDLDGFYTPFLWDNPWTSALYNKKVLVIHPFIDTIKQQYEKRDKLFENKNVLPDFKEIHYIKAVQSIADNSKDVGFGTWFEALKYMEKEIDDIEFDVAIIGCGAYAMDLAAYIKRKGKIAIHLAGWTQMLFGIYGKRWLEDQPQYSKYINEYWVRPSKNEKPKGADKVEGGCYW